MYKYCYQINYGISFRQKHVFSMLLFVENNFSLKWSILRAKQKNNCIEIFCIKIAYISTNLYIFSSFMNILIKPYQQLPVIIFFVFYKAFYLCAINIVFIKRVFFKKCNVSESFCKRLISNFFHWTIY